MNELTNAAVNISNALLAVLLFHIGEFATKVGLPERSCSVADVRRFVPDPNGTPGGWFTFKSGNEYWFNRGYVNGFRSPRNYYELQDPTLVPRFYGRLNMDKSQAVELARRTIMKLGYTAEMLYADLVPEVTMPPRIGTNIVPHFLIEWLAPNRPAASVVMEINGSIGCVEKLRFLNRNLERSPPAIPGIAVPTASAALEHPPPVDSGLLSSALWKIGRFAQCLDLPITVPIGTNAIEKAAFGLEYFEGDTRIKFTNGFVFTLQGGNVSGFKAADTFFAAENEVRVKDFVGSRRLTEVEAIALVRKAVVKLGYPTALVSSQPTVYRPYGGARDIVPRCRLDWFPTERGMEGSMVIAEVDGDSATLKWLFILFCARGATRK